MRRTALIIILALSSCLSLGAKAFGSSTLASVERSFLGGDYKKAEKEALNISQSSSSSRKEKEESYLINALSILKQNYFKKARESFEAFLEKFPKSKRAVDAYIGIGDSYFLEGSINKALKVYEDILDRYPNDKNISIVYYRIGNCHKTVGSNDKAKEYFDKTNSAAPMSFEAKMPTAFIQKKTTQTESKEYFSVQAGSFKNKRNAEKLTSKLSGEGFESFMEIPSNLNDKLYRVKVGRLSSKEEAERLAARLKRSGHNTKICAKDVCE